MRDALRYVFVDEERRVYGDSAYASQKALIRGTLRRRKTLPISASASMAKSMGPIHDKSRIRATVEHVFAVVKRLWGLSKVRYRKNANRSFVALGLAKTAPVAHPSSSMMAR